MGREIREVPPNWDHPKMVNWSDGRLQPMYDRTFEQAATEWKAEFAAWENGGRPDDAKDMEFWEWHGTPPDREYYRPWKDEDATWFQVWETVSEGTPVTPPFATREELVNYLIDHGDFWQQKRWARGDSPMQPKPPGYSRENAEAFVLGDGYAPSMVVIRKEGRAEILDGINAVGSLIPQR